MDLLTVGQIEKFCKKHKYVLLRESGNYRFAINTKVINISNNRGHHGNEKTVFIGVEKCDLMTYIYYKIPFYPLDKKETSPQNGGE